MEKIKQRTTDRIFNAITANGMRDMDEVRFYQAANEVIDCYEQPQNAKKPFQQLGEPHPENKHTIAPDENGVWWITHHELGVSEPLKQWLTGKPSGICG